MSKIFNWLFGACFRTLGRFLAIFLVCVLLIFIGSKIGIELPDWLALNVKAADYLYGYAPGWADNLPNLTRADYKECSSSNNCSTLKEIYVDYLENEYSIRSFVVNPWTMDIGPNGYVINSPVGSLKKNYLYNIEYYICSNNSMQYVVPDIYATDYQTAINPGNVYNVVTRGNLDLKPFINSDRQWPVCYLYSGLVVPEQDYTWSGLRLRSNGTTTYGTYISTIAVQVKELGIYTSALEDTIRNSGFATSESVEQVQQSVNQVQQEIEQTNDTITNEDITGAEDSASGFFNDFTTETFGLTSIITAPLNAINSLISSTCSPLFLPLPFVDKNLSLPCMSSVYSQYFGGFFTLYQLITTGLISYYIIVRIFNLVKDFKNPEHDEIEVVDL